jgi:hypothetical protein
MAKADQFLACRPFPGAAPAQAIKQIVVELLKVGELGPERDLGDGSVAAKTSQANCMCGRIGVQHGQFEEIHPAPLEDRQTYPKRWRAKRQYTRYSNSAIKSEQPRRHQPYGQYGYWYRWKFEAKWDTEKHTPLATVLMSECAKILPELELFTLGFTFPSIAPVDDVYCVPSDHLQASTCREQPHCALHTPT